jgi:phospholipid/cholesterol/gamma-HCH transport system substrate-binding protein
MKQAIRKHLVDFIAIVVLVVVAGGISLYILVNQNLNAPAWVPVLGKEHFTLKAEFATAQAVMPGQGQTVNIAGVPIGQVVKSEVANGRAIVSMDIEPKYKGRIFPNATMLLRPKTGLKDMVIALDPGSASGGAALEGGDTLPVSQTAPDVNFEEFLSVLDADVRDYLVLLINGGGQGLVRNGRNLAQVLRQFDPLQRNIAQINGQLQQRQANLKNVTTDLNLLLNELGSRDTHLTEFVSSSNDVFKYFASQQQNIKKTIALLPAALAATNGAVTQLNKTSQITGPVLTALLPTATNLAPLQVASQKFFKQTQGSINGDLYTFAKDPTVRQSLKYLQSSSANLQGASPGLQKTGVSLNHGVNDLAAAPADGSVPPYLFNLYWLGHNTNASLLNQDAAGPVRQSVFLASRNTFSTAFSILGSVCAPAGNPAVGSPSIWTTVELLRAPRPNGLHAPICVGPTGP